MSHYSSSGHYPAPSSTSGGGASRAPSTNYAYPAPPTTLAPPQHSSSSYSSHRSTSSHHSDYRYHPYHQSSSSRSTYDSRGSGSGSGSGSSTNYGYSAAAAPPTHSSSSSSAYNNGYSSHSHSHSNMYGSSSSYNGHHSSSSSRYGGGSASSSNLDRYNNSSSARRSNFDRKSASTMSLPSPFGRKQKGKAPRNEYGIPYGQPGASLRAPDWSKIELPSFQKNFYRSASSIESMSDLEVDKWREKNDITVTGDNVPRPIRSFEESGFPPYILSEIVRAGFVKPTAIQSQGWPMAMSGRDVIGIAETGSGKTLAFLLPCIVHINAQPLLRDGDGPIVLVIAPTRELAVQIEGEVSKFAYSSRIKHCCVYGGVSRRSQARTLRTGVEIIICTPGRLLDFLETSVTNLQRVTYLVIDEADRLLDMGFEPQLKSMLSQVRPDRQILMWSATWPKQVQELSKQFIANSNDVLQVSVGNCGRNISANHNVKQIIDVCDEHEKSEKLYKILRDDNPNGKILIFTCTKRQCDWLYSSLYSRGNKVCIIHGDKQQYDRDAALSNFKSGKCRIMCATDVASRGIHVDDISCVINYDFPANIEDYVHRIGRTGRCGKKGRAISFFTKMDAKRANKLINVLKDAKQDIPTKLINLSNSTYNTSSSSYSRYSNNRQ